MSRYIIEALEKVLDGRRGRKAHLAVPLEGVQYLRISLRPVACFFTFRDLNSPTLTTFFLHYTMFRIPLATISSVVVIVSILHKKEG